MPASDLPSPSDPDALTRVAATLDTSSLPAVGTIFAGYRLEGAIGSGGTAVVYRAIDERLGRTVALKVLQPSAVTHARERFLREVRLIAGLQHPNVVLLYGAGEDHGHAWAAMELLPHSLAHELQQRGRLGAPDVIRIARDACLGLDAAWQRGIVHRDVKPSNLLRDGSGTVKIADFGLAKDLAIELHLTAPDVILGTPLYVSPEQASGRASGLSADLYSLGATLYHLVAGRPPFHSASALDVIVRHAVEPPPPLPPDVPSPLARLILQLLEKDPARRPRSYAEVIAALDETPESDQPLEPDPQMPASGAARGVGGSLVAAARAALDMGRHPRVQALVAPLVDRREPGWVPAAFTLAQSREQAGDLGDAERVLELVVAHANEADERAYALWSLGRLAERQSAAALTKAIEIYGRIAGISTGLLPKTLIEARISELRRRRAFHNPTGSSSKASS